MNPIALIVDDEVDLCRLMQITLNKMGINSDVAYNLQDALALFAKNNYSFCLTDLALPDGSGIELVKTVTKSGKNTPIAVITAHGTVDLAIEALKIGAFDFVNKPLELSRLRLLVENAMKAGQTTDIEAKISPEDELLDARLIGTSAAMASLKSTIKKLAKSQAPVFLWGASGTGKEVVARLIHDLSPRKDGAFVPVNCGAIPSELMESEFFGHKKGSFTGATTDKIGLFQQADGGTLFLDEVADLPLAMQVKLLRAIQEKTVRAIGSTKETPVDIRILSATHKDLSALVNKGHFRQDLFYRINVIMVQLPKLNERREDIALLANHFLNLIATDWQIDTPALSDNAKDALKVHDFEGNVRELRNLLERAVTLSDGQIIDKAHLFEQSFQNTTASPYQDQKNSINQGVSLNFEKPIKVQANYGTIATGNLNTPNHKSDDYSQALSNSTALQADDATTKTDSASNHDNYSDRHNNDHGDNGLPKEGLEAYLLNQEKMLIIRALNLASGNKTQAAKLLGTSFRSLRYRMKKLEISETYTVGDFNAS